MNFPICESDAFEKVLCDSCKQKLSSGIISSGDVASSELLAELSKTFPIQDVDFVQSVDLDETRLLVCRGSIGSLIGKEGKVVSEISKRFGKRVRIVEQSKSIKKTVQDLVGKARVLGVNELHTVQGVRYKIILSKKDGQKIGYPLPELSKAIQTITRQPCTIELD